jgi:protease YdgD
VAAVPLHAAQRHSDAAASHGSIVRATEYPWSAVAKLNNGVFGSCSAVVVSRRYALTAAHCLFYRATGKFLPAQSLHLVMGFDEGKYSDHLRVSAFYVPPAYNPRRPFETLAQDWALLLISEPRRSAIRPLSLASRGNVSAVANLMTAGYSKDVPFRMTADRRCHYVGRSSDSGLLFDSCKSPLGFSGGPVLIENPDNHSYSIAGIHVGNQVWKGESLAISIPSEAIWRVAEPCIENEQCPFQHFATGRDPSAAELLGGLPNLGIATARTTDEVIGLTNSPR